MIDLDKLIKLAEVADAEANKVGTIFHAIDGVNNESLVNFIKAANPQTIKKLCEVIMVYEKSLFEIRDMFYADVASDMCLEALEKGKSILEGE